MGRLACLSRPGQVAVVWIFAQLCWQGEMKSNQFVGHFQEHQPPDLRSDTECTYGNVLEQTISPTLKRLGTRPGCKAESM